MTPLAQLLNDPPALRDLVVGRLYDMWEGVLGAEWERQLKRRCALLARGRIELQA